MSLVLDETMYKAFLKDGIADETARAFGHLFAYIQGRCELENYLKEKFEKIGLLEPDGVTFNMEDIDDDIEWILLTQCFEGLIERKFDKERKIYVYQNTKLGENKAIVLMNGLTKK